MRKSTKATLATVTTDAMMTPRMALVDNAVDAAAVDTPGSVRAEAEKQGGMLFKWQ